MAEDKNFRHIVRIQNTDVDGNKHIVMALQKIKGVGDMFSRMVCNLANIDKTKRAGILSDLEVKRLDDVLANPQKLGAPEWMLNRRLDYETGEIKHLLTADLKFQNENDKKRLQKIKSYRGLRLAVGLPVRGQRTKSNFRRNKGKGLGVSKKK